MCRAMHTSHFAYPTQMHLSRHLTKLTHTILPIYYTAQTPCPLPSTLAAQVGFGRVGSAFWAFELAGVVPDIVTLGKPAGNGFPMAAAVTSHDVAAAFDNGMEYFSTFGGCTAAGAVGLAVLHAMEEEGMQAAAADTGAYLERRLRQLQQVRCC